jgi:hypothetical protein
VSDEPQQAGGRIFIVPKEAPLVQHLGVLTLNAHGAPLVITQGMRLSITSVMLGFFCGKGCFHEFRRVTLQDGQEAWMESTIVPPPPQPGDPDHPDDLGDGEGNSDGSN